MNISKLIQLINTLPYSQKTALFDAIYPLVKNSSDNLNDYLKDIRESWFASKSHCPHCGDEHIVGHGKYRGRQLYKCKAYNRTFNDTTVSPLAGTHYPEKWTQHIQLLLKGAVLKELAETLEIYIYTAFYWRHKVLSALNSNEPEELSGIIESDEKFFLESNKGKDQVKRYGKCDARKRGGVSKFRGISREQVYVVAMDRNGAHGIKKGWIW